jgi:hypothetical protein
VNLLATAFEKRLRQLLRAERERSPELRKEFKQARRKNSTAASRAGRKLLLPLFWILIPASLILKQNNPELALAVISFWTAGTAFFWGQKFFQQFYGSEELVVLHMLPLSDADIFTIQKRRYLGSLAWVFWELLIAYMVLGLFPAGLRPPLWALLGVALAQSLLVMAMGIHLASYFHMLPLGAISGLLRMIAIILFLAGINGGEFIGPVTNFSQWFFPTGWLNYVLTQTTVKNDWVAAFMLIPVAALIFAMRHSWQRLRGFYSLEGFEIIPSSAGAALEQAEPELTDSSFGPRHGPTEIEDRILAGGFLERSKWENTGWFERIAGRLLTPRERVLTEFLAAQKPGWSRHLQLTLLVWAVACLVVWCFGAFGGTVVFFSAYILATASLPLFGGSWRGLRQTPSGGVYLPGFSVFPIGFNEISKILIKVNLLRIIAAAPLLLTFSIVAAYRLGYTPLAGLEVSFEIVLTIIALQPVVILLPLSKATNDTSKMRSLWLFLFLPMLMAMIALVMSLFFVQSVPSKLILYIVLLLIALLFFTLYRWSYRQGKFDLLSERTGEQ